MEIKSTEAEWKKFCELWKAYIPCNKCMFIQSCNTDGICDVQLKQLIQWTNTNKQKLTKDDSRYLRIVWCKECIYFSQNICGNYESPCNGRNVAGEFFCAYGRHWSLE